MTLGVDVFRAARLLRRHRADVCITKYGAGNLAARLLLRKTISFNDDDADVVPLIVWTSYPFAHSVLAPTVTRMGRFDRKTTRFRGNFELFYLHPNRFTPDASVRAKLGLATDEPYAIIRLSALTAHHDMGKRGVGERLLNDVIALTRDRVRLFISSEKPLSPAFEPLRFPIPPQWIHHALAFAEFFLGDSQTMTSEAAVLGTPAFRLNDFVGRLSYLEELQQFGLSFGFHPGEEGELVSELTRVLDLPDRRVHFDRVRRQFLADKIDPVPWFADQIRALIGVSGSSRGALESRPHGAR